MGMIQGAGVRSESKAGRITGESDMRNEIR